MLFFPEEVAYFHQIDNNQERSQAITAISYFRNPF